MKKIILISLILIILSSVFLGCVKAPVSTPTPTATPAATETAIPAVVQTTPSPTPTLAPTPRMQAVYKFYVHDIDGFYRVRALNTTKIPEYTNLNLTLRINAGDKVIWESESEDYTITIVSEQGLWDNTSAKLRWNNQQFSYTFTQPGTYGISVREFPKIRRQKIIVNP
ncbi:MAG: hypothetical protein WC568_07485 [Candidatus Methanoperedens sp.]